MSEEEFLTPQPIQDEDLLYRQAHIKHLAKLPNDKKKRVPNESHFKPDSDGLSVNWDRHLSVSGCYHIIGLTFSHGTTSFKDYRAFRVFSLPVKFVKAIEGIMDVKHTPAFNGNPAKVGSPNNYAHASLFYPDEEEIRLKLADYCLNQFEECYCPIDFVLLDTEIDQLRERLDNTRYHRLRAVELSTDDNNSENTDCTTLQ